MATFTKTRQLGTTNTGIPFYVGTWADDPAPTPALLPAPPVTPVSPTIDPKIEANALYGKPMALFAGGFARIGASPAPIVGPYLNAGVVDFIVSFGVPVPVTGDRKIYAIYLDNELAWSSVAGGTLPAHGTFTSEAFDFIFKPGTLTQTVCSLETEKFPGDENAYRPQMLLQIRSLPYQRFLDRTGKPVPYVACDIGDVTDGAVPSDGITIGDGWERIAYSPWANYTSSTAEAISITDFTDAILLKDNFTVVGLGQAIARTHRNIDLLQSDKLRIKDRGSNVTPDIVFDRDSIIGDENPIQIIRAGATTQRRELELIAIDPDQDYTAVPSLSKIPRDPFVISAAVGKDTITSPLVLDADTRQALVTFTHQYEENARKKIAFKVRAIGYEVEPGDLVALVDIADGIDNEIWKVTQTLHGANFVNDIEAEAILRCSIYGDDFDPFLAFVVLLMGFNGNVTDESPAVHGNATVIGGANTTSSSPIFGSESLELDASTDSEGLYYPDHADWQLSNANSDQFCVEVWATTTTTTPTDSTIIGVWGGGSPITSWMLYVNTTGDGELTFLAEDSSGNPWSATPESSGLSWVVGTKYYFRVDKDATGKVRIYRGAFGDAIAPMIGSATPTNSSISREVGSASAVLSIGCNSNGGGRTWPGKVDELRITKGSSRNASDSGVPVPTDEFQRV